jgi:hypothetical protein
MHAMDGLRYWVETVGPVADRRGQMMADLIEDGRVVQTYPVGSPAPIATVQAAADDNNRSRTPLGYCETCHRVRYLGVVRVDGNGAKLGTCTQCVREGS